jgi:tetratricopeptide (TPR) repeat protein
MTEVRTDAIPALTQKLFEKGFSAFERGNLDIAVDLLTRCVVEAPTFARARRFLRIVEIQRVKKVDKKWRLRPFADLVGLPAYLVGKLALKQGNADQAMAIAETLMAINPLNPVFLAYFINAARLANLLDAAVSTLELAVEASPDHAVLLRELGDLYNEVGNYRLARRAYERVVALRPHDAATAKLFKDVEARDSMQSGGWEDTTDKQDSYRSLIKDQTVAKAQDIQAKAVVTGNDLETLVAEQRAAIAKDATNINAYRALMRVYRQNKKYPEAIAVAEEALAVNTADPELDRMLSELKALDFDARIAALKQTGTPGEAAALEAQRNQFVFDDVLARVARYPNDLRLRFELGLQHFDKGAWDEAIQQLQLAQRSPRERTDALYFLARCFRQKGQADLATMQLETVLEQLPTMDEARKRVLFELGEIAEDSGNTARALVLYKEIYGADIAYRDIGDKMTRLYKTTPRA